MNTSWFDIETESFRVSLILLGNLEKRKSRKSSLHSYRNGTIKLVYVEREKRVVSPVSENRVRDYMCMSILYMYVYIEMYTFIKICRDSKTLPLEKRENIVDLEGNCAKSTIADQFQWDQITILFDIKVAFYENS